MDNRWADYYAGAFEDWFSGQRSGPSSLEKFALACNELQEHWLTECFKRCLLTEETLDFRQAYKMEQSLGKVAQFFFKITLLTFKCDNQYVSQLAVAQVRGKYYALIWWNREYVLRPNTKALVLYEK